MIKEVIKIAKRAGSAILKIYQSNDFQIATKEDKEKSPLTRADLESNAIIIKDLNALSDYPIVTEESDVEYKVRKKWKKFWLVDPLDGTRDFIAKGGGFTVNIALIINDKPVLGVVYAPAVKLTYWAEKGRGAFKNGKKIFNSSKRKNLIGADSIFHSTKETLEFFKRYHIKTIRKYGSALKLCRLAEGKIDVYPRFNGTKEWDTAAGHIIANEAGCNLIDVSSGQELTYNKENIKNNYFVASRMDLNFNL